MNVVSLSSGVSVAMSTYNGEKYILEQLESLAAQVQLPVELVVTDDGSTDRTVEIVEAFAKRAVFPVKVVRNEVRLGFADNFLKAAGLCSAELIAFSDQDDVWMADKIKLCAEAFDRPEVMLAIHSSLIWHGGDQFGPIHHHFGTRSKLSPISVDPLGTMPGFSMVIRRQLLDYGAPEHRPRSIFMDAKMSHDEWCWFLAAFVGDIVKIPDILAWYRQHDANVAGAPKKSSFWKVVAESARAAPYAQFATHIRERIETIFNVDGPGMSEERRLHAVTYLRQRLVFCEQRSKVYDLKLTFKDRLSAVICLLRSGGYWGKRRGAPWGGRAMAKDLLFGVPGLYKLLLTQRYMK